MTEQTTDFSDVLAESIEAIERGELTSRACMEMYPEYADRLGELLPVMTMLREAPQVEPGLVFKQESLGRLLAQLPPVDIENETFLQVVRQKWRRIPFSLWVPTRRVGLAWTIILTLIATLIAGTGVLYAADTAVPGESLYQVDRALETLQLSLANEPGERVTLRLAQAEERLKEAETLAGQDDAINLQYALEGYGESILAAGKTIQLISGEERENLLDVFDEAITKHEPIIASLLEEDDPDHDSDRCPGGEDFSQAQAIADAEGVPVDQVIAWYCSGLGYGEIKLAFRIGEQTDIAVGELIQLREDLGWGRIMQAAGMIGNGKDRSNGREDDGEPTGTFIHEADEESEIDGYRPDDLKAPDDDYDPVDDYGPNQEENGDDRCASGKIHPEAQAIAEANDETVEQIMDWFCSGLGFGEIKLAFKISNQTDITTSELIKQRESLGWGQIMQDAGLIGKKDNKLTDPSNLSGKPGQAGKPDHAAPPDNNGNAKADQSSEDKGSPDHAEKPDDSGKPDKDESPKDNGPPKSNSPSGDEKERNKPDKTEKDKNSDKSNNSKKG